MRWRSAWRSAPRRRRWRHRAGIDGPATTSALNVGRAASPSSDGGSPLQYVEKGIVGEACPGVGAVDPCTRVSSRPRTPLPLARTAGRSGPCPARRSDRRFDRGTTGPASNRSRSGRGLRGTARRRRSPKTERTQRRRSWCCRLQGAGSGCPACGGLRAAAHRAPPPAPMPPPAPCRTTSPRPSASSGVVCTPHPVGASSRTQISEAPRAPPAQIGIARVGTATNAAHRAPCLGLQYRNLGSSFRGWAADASLLDGVALPAELSTDAPR